MIGGQPFRSKDLFHGKPVRRRATFLKAPAVFSPPCDTTGGHGLNLSHPMTHRLTSPRVMENMGNRAECKYAIVVSLLLRPPPRKWRGPAIPGAAWPGTVSRRPIPCRPPRVARGDELIVRVVLELFFRITPESAPERPGIGTLKGQGRLPPAALSNRPPAAQESGSQRLRGLRRPGVFRRPRR